MSAFRYQAVARDGTPQSGLVQADSREQAIGRLQAQGLLIVTIRPQRGGSWTITGARQAIAARQVVHFTEQLATLLEAGQPLESALSQLVRQARGKPMGVLLKRLLEQVKAGASLSAAMAREGRVFSTFYLSLVRAGEATGTLADALAQLAGYLERTQAQRAELHSALIYPAFLVVGVLGSLVLLLAYVVPQFVPVFEDLQVALPLLTQATLWLGEALAQWGLYLGLLVVGAGLAGLIALREPHRRQALDARLLRLGAVGRFLQSLDTARLAQTLGTLLDKRVPLLASLDIACQVANNRALRVALEQATRDTREGATLATALARTQVFPELAVQMIQVGEQSGQLGSMLLKLAAIYDKQTQTSIKRFMAALVPTLTLVMTALVALIMLAILMPLMSLTSNL